jgi:CheY-like chemotaxis protein
VGAAIKLWLEVEGADVTYVEDGPDGIEASRNGAFDLVIVDLSMPGLNGLKIIEALRRIQPELPIIVMSGMLHQSDGASIADEAIALGAARVLAKPFRPSDLLRAIEAALGRSLGDRQGPDTSC